eukprot:TRINITY_DN1303_c0_g1_i1.p2 TRINITY_DN1303_c0_g1~~TRINITY_DN1303_c0_g1_i1.p2  ORF type:complete len:75 (+),score=9.22 TRINITY_DN1303_c0_g1_i1:237-461(+)
MEICHTRNFLEKLCRVNVVDCFLPLDVVKIICNFLPVSANVGRPVHWIFGSPIEQGTQRHTNVMNFIGEHMDDI